MPEVGLVALQGSEYWIWPQSTSPPQFHLQAPLPFSFTWSQPKLIVWEANRAPTWIRCQFDQACISSTYISTCPCLEESSRLSNSPIKIEKLSTPLLPLKTQLPCRSATPTVASESTLVPAQGYKLMIKHWCSLKRSCTFQAPKWSFKVIPHANLCLQTASRESISIVLCYNPGWDCYPSFWSLSGVASAIFLPEMARHQFWYSCLIMRRRTLWYCVKYEVTGSVRHNHDFVSAQD